VLLQVVVVDLAFDQVLERSLEPPASLVDLERRVALERQGKHLDGEGSRIIGLAILGELLAVLLVAEPGALLLESLLECRLQSDVDQRARPVLGLDLERQHCRGVLGPPVMTVDRQNDIGTQAIRGITHIGPLLHLADHPLAANVQPERRNLLALLHCLSELVEELLPLVSARRNDRLACQLGPLRRDATEEDLVKQQRRPLHGHVLGLRCVGLGELGPEVLAGILDLELLDRLLDLLADVPLDDVEGLSLDARLDLLRHLIVDDHLDELLLHLALANHVDRLALDLGRVQHLAIDGQRLGKGPIDRLGLLESRLQRRSTSTVLSSLDQQRRGGHGREEKCGGNDYPAHRGSRSQDRTRENKSRRYRIHGLWPQLATGQAVARNAESGEEG